MSLHLLTPLTKALADEHRLRMLMLLSGGELCVCQIIEIFPLANSTVSKHLAILRQAGLLQSRKSGRWVYFALAQQPDPVVQQALDWVYSSLQSDPQIRADAAQLSAVLQIDPVELCRRQSGRDCC